MTRHAKNNTASACYSYHERQKDNAKSGYGTQKARLSKDSIKDFDACCLTLQPCRNPVVTPDGFLYDKEAILEYILHQKAENARKLRLYEKQLRKEERDEEEAQEAEKRMKTESFLKQEKSVANPSVFASTSKNSEERGSVCNMSNGRDKQISSFWIPQMTPESSKTKLEKPDQTVYCPLSGKPLKAKNLIPIRFTPVDKNVSASALITKKERYMCAVTHDVLGNSVPCAVLRTSGNVVTVECVEKILKKDMIDPTNGKQMEEKDIIVLQRGGTGYASTNKLEAELKKPVMQA